ncbi:hypothetical protein Bca101_083085 [Brassica carinata]
MVGVPDLSALLAEKLHLLKKSATRAPTTGTEEADVSRQHNPDPVKQNVDGEQPANKPKNKKPGQKAAKKKVPSSAEAASAEEIVPSEGSSKDSKAKKKKRERSREDSSDSHDHEGMVRDFAEKMPASKTPDERPKKKPKKKVVEKVPRSPSSGSVLTDHGESAHRDGETLDRSPPASLSLANVQGGEEPSGGARSEI